METKEKDFIFTERTSSRQRYDKRLIMHVVEMFEQGVPGRDLINKYGMSGCTLRDWLNRYSSANISQRRYTTSERRSVVRAVEAGMGVTQARIAFNISSRSLIHRWMKEFKEENSDLSMIKPVEVSKKKTDPSESVEVHALKKALEEANLKVRALNTMIDIAEEQLKIDIRKKSGARQSSK